MQPTEDSARPDYHHVNLEKWNDPDFFQLTDSASPRQSASLPDLCSAIGDFDYGVRWPHGTVQLVKELQGFYYARKYQNKKQIKGFKSGFHHALNITRYLWGGTQEHEDKGVCIYKDTKWGRVYNTYFLQCLYELCQFEDLTMSGPASAAKTFAAAVYGLINFYCKPLETCVLVSTTSGSASERRVWGDVKKLHRNALFKANSMATPGHVVEYLKAIVYDESKSMEDSEKKSERDFRSGLIVIPIANDSKGETALDTIAGTKQKSVIWILDEMPMMMDGVDRPIGALEPNPFFQFIGIGNARGDDPHKRKMEPAAGWGSVSGKTSGRWKTRDGGNALFLHGEEGPNDSPIIDQSQLTEKYDLPFGYLSNKISREKNALRYGNGDIGLGKTTIDYNRFSIGYWTGSSVNATVLSEEYVKRYNAHLPPDPWSYGTKRTFNGSDFAFTIGNDDNSLIFATCGYNSKGKPQIVFDSENINIRPIASTNQDFCHQTAQQYVKYCNQRRCEPNDSGFDVSNNSGIMLEEIIKVWNRQGMVGISSLGNANNDKKYGNRVTEIWFTVRRLIATGYCRGFNVLSKYAKDLFERTYETVGDRVVVERKKYMSKRLRRSPDNGDAFAYLCEMIVNSGFIDMSGPDNMYIEGAEQKDADYTSDKRTLDDIVKGIKKPVAGIPIYSRSVQEVVYSR